MIFEIAFKWIDETQFEICSFLLSVAKSWVECEKQLEIVLRQVLFLAWPEHQIYFAKLFMSIMTCM